MTACVSPRKAIRGSALAAVDRGFAVFPAAPWGNKPAVPDCELAATRDADDLRHWYRSRAHNMAVGTGPSGLVVLSLDDGRGQPAPQRWTSGRNSRARRVRRLSSELVPIPTTRHAVDYICTIACQPSRLYGTPAGWFGCRIGTQVRGGFVVAAGSVRREGRYGPVRDTHGAPLPPTAPPPPAAATVGGNAAYVCAAVGAECEAPWMAPVDRPLRLLPERAAARCRCRRVAAARFRNTAMMNRMAKRTAARGVGRPSKGPRDVIVTRVPTVDSAELRELAEARDWSFSETAAALIRIGLRHRDELPADVPPRVQEELPLTRAS